MLLKHRPSRTRRIRARRRLIRTIILHHLRLFHPSIGHLLVDPSQTQLVQVATRCLGDLRTVRIFGDGGLDPCVSFVLEWVEGRVDLEVFWSGVGALLSRARFVRVRVVRAARRDGHTSLVVDGLGADVHQHVRFPLPALLKQVFYLLLTAHGRVHARGRSSGFVHGVEALALFVQEGIGIALRRLRPIREGLARRLLLVQQLDLLRLLPRLLAALAAVAEVAPASWGFVPRLPLFVLAFA